MSCLLRDILAQPCFVKPKGVQSVYNNGTCTFVAENPMSFLGILSSKT